MKWTRNTHSNRTTRRWDSSTSFVVLAPALSLSNRARTDTIFPFIPGSFCQHISRYLKMDARLSYPMELQKYIQRRLYKVDPTISSNDGVDVLRPPTANCVTCLFIACCCDTCIENVNSILSWSVSANLVDENHLTKPFNKTSDFSSISRLIEEPSRLPLHRQGLRLFFNVFQGPTECQPGRGVVDLMPTLPTACVSQPLVDPRWGPPSPDPPAVSSPMGPIPRVCL